MPLRDHFRHSRHKAHLDFIRVLSEAVERACLNFVRYRSCRLERIDDLRHIRAW